MKVNIVRSWGKEGFNVMADYIEAYLADDITFVYSDNKPTNSKVDLVHFISYRLFQPTSVPNISFFTFPEKNRPEMEKLYLDVARATDHCTVSGKRYKRYLINRGVPASKITVVYLGVDREVFKPKIKLGICANQSRSIRKGEKLLAEFFQKAAEGNEYVSLKPTTAGGVDVQYFEFIFAGKGWENYIQDYKRRNPQVNINYLGSLDLKELIKFYQNIDYLLIPSSYESTPRPCIEALACGKEIISRPVGIVAELKGITIFDTVDDLIQVLKHLVTDKRDQVKDMTWENFSRKTQKIYRMLMVKQ